MPAVLSPHARNIALVVAAALFAQFLDGVIIVTALPQMARDFHVGTLDMSIGITIYLLAVTICIPAAAWKHASSCAGEWCRARARLGKWQTMS